MRTERHPDAAKVHRVWVDAGDGVERHVWCGAFNMSAGDVVPLATPGTVDARRQGDRAQADPRSIDSQGMLCSARELGLGDDHTGILILPAEHAARRSVRTRRSASRPRSSSTSTSRATVPTAGATSASHARSAASLGLALLPAPQSLSRPTARHDRATVELVDGERCPRFTTIVLSGVAGQSVTGVDRVRRLQAAGMRSINNVVDVSNYVMLELNQPNHAYDLDTLGGQRLPHPARP